MNFMKEFKTGFKIEKEHSKTVGHNAVTIARIALDHLEEDPHYYRKLVKLEKTSRRKKIYI